MSGGAVRPEKRVTARSNEPQKKCEGLVLPRKRARKIVEHAVGLHELAPEHIRRRPHRSLRARDPASNGIAPSISTGMVQMRTIDVERTQRAHHRRVEIRGRHGAERDALLARVAGVQHELMSAEIEIDLQRAAAIAASRPVVSPRAVT